MLAGLVVGIVIGSVPLLRALTTSTVEFLRPSRRRSRRGTAGHRPLLRVCTRTWLLRIVLPGASPRIVAGCTPDPAGGRWPSTWESRCFSNQPTIILEDVTVDLHPARDQPTTHSSAASELRAHVYELIQSANAGKRPGPSERERPQEAAGPWETRSASMTLIRWARMAASAASGSWRQTASMIARCCGSDTCGRPARKASRN